MIVLDVLAYPARGTHLRDVQHALQPDEGRPGLDSAQQLHGITNAKREIKALASICEADRSC